MDVTDKVIGVVIGFAVVAVGLPLAFGFLADGNWTLTVGETTFDTAPIIILLAVIVVLGIVVLIYRNTRGGK